MCIALLLLTKSEKTQTLVFLLLSAQGGHDSNKYVTLHHLPLDDPQINARKQKNSNNLGEKVKATHEPVKLRQFHEEINGKYCVGDNYAMLVFQSYCSSIYPERNPVMY